MTRSDVQVVHWNPRRWTRAPLGVLIRHRGRVGNFGDLLGPAIVRRLVADAGLSHARPAPRRLVTVGSILRLAQDGDTVWGTGANGKSVAEPYPFTHLDVRAVRGPLTRALLESKGIDAPAVYGDPGLLVGMLWPDLATLRDPSGPVLVVPNFHELATRRLRPGELDPRSDLDVCLRRIARSSLVVGSSLHGLVVAESLGIPARRVRYVSEPSFKYDDYYAGTGREQHTPASSVAEALEMGGEAGPRWDPAALVAAFPRDLWLS
ncbi:GumL protein [Cellulomonas chitinilytica]|uniref:GumL protein n=1 Tax=Cellulomonas chitinilytica TaxID=398759 RepID=A0A919U2U8_9CELL|nr:polysaccharide pyruvyl transferase family protein [Cellulomonas chitinilytica]GIG22671.1 GumL protein [Cellulomonas chitinilytica]